MQPNLKLLGCLLILLGVLQLSAGFTTQEHINTLNRFYMSPVCPSSDPSCPILSSNTELHVVYSWLNSLAEICIGAWLVFACKWGETKPEEKRSASKLAGAERGNESGPNLEIFLKGLSDGEEKLMRLAYERGQARQNELPGMSGFSKAKISLLLARLEKQGLIKKEPKGKTNIITPTQKF